jgi:hypothetical protein
MNNINNQNKNNVSPYLFTKKINTNYKLVPFNVSVNDMGKTKYLPPVAKEWKNNVYNYNSKNIMNYPVYDLNVNSLIKGYFNMYFENKFLKHKFISPKKKRKSLNKIFVSKAEIKHTNSKAIITIYVYNRERLILLKKIKGLKKKFLKLVVFLLILNTSSNKIFKYLPFSGLRQNINKSFVNPSIKSLSRKIYRILEILRKYRLRLSLNKYKLEDKFLFKLSQFIGKYYGKKIEFNIVNLKSIAYNGDIFTEILTSKVKKEKSSPIWRINTLLSKVVFPKANRIIERGRVEKNVDLEFVGNKYKNLNISSIINTNVFVKDNLNKLLDDLHFKTNLEKENKLNKDNISLDKVSYLKIRDIILDNIKYKNMGGAKLIVKGRLTRRYRADRALYKLKWKGGLKNIDSAFKGLSTVVYRGYLDSNVEKSMVTSKRRIGSFAVRGWFSGK